MSSATSTTDHPELPTIEADADLRQRALAVGLKITDVTGVVERAIAGTPCPACIAHLAISWRLLTATIVAQAPASGQTVSREAFLAAAASAWDYNERMKAAGAKPVAAQPEAVLQ